MLGSVGYFPSYNLPIFLFGQWCLFQRNLGSDVSESLRFFNIIVGVSVVLDVLWVIGNWNSNGAFVKIIVLLNMIIKPLTFEAVQSLQQSYSLTLGSSRFGAGSVDSASNYARVAVHTNDFDESPELPTSNMPSNSSKVKKGSPTSTAILLPISDDLAKDTKDFSQL